MSTQPLKKLLAAAIFGLMLTACENPERAVQRAGDELAEFRAQPDDAHQQRVESALARVSDQIQRLEKQGKVSEADKVRRQLQSLQTEYQAAKFAKTLNDARQSLQGLGEVFLDAGRTFTETLKSGSKALGGSPEAQPSADE